MNNPFGNFGSAISGFGAAPDMTGGMDTTMRGAGDYASQVTQAAGPDMNVSWEDILGSDDYGQYSQLYSDLPYQNANFSDAVIDWGKFGVNSRVPMGGLGAMTSYGGEDGGIGSIVFAPRSYGDMSVQGQTLLYKGNPFTTLRAYDRDPTEAMGAMDPRVQLILSDAEGWNDPLSNYLQGRGTEFTNRMIGNLNYRARNGDSSSMMFDPATYYIAHLGGDAAKVLNYDPDAVANAQAGWASNMTPGAQSQRHEAMFGGGGLFGDLGSFLGPLGMITGQPWLTALGAVNSASQGNWLGAALGALGAYNGFSGGIGDMGSMGYENAFDTGAMSASINAPAGLDIGGLPVDNWAPVADATVTPNEFVGPHELTPLRDYWDATGGILQEAAMLPEIKNVKTMLELRRKLESMGMKEEQIQAYLEKMRDQIEQRQAERSAAVSDIPERRRVNPAFGNRGMWG